MTSAFSDGALSGLFETDNPGRDFTAFNYGTVTALDLTTSANTVEVDGTVYRNLAYLESSWSTTAVPIPVLLALVSNGPPVILGILNISADA